MKKVYFLIGLIIVTLPGFAQQAQLEGRLSDAASGNILSAVTVTVDGSNLATTTNAEGRFSLSLPAAKNYKISFSSSGYKTKSVDDIEVIAGKANSIEVVLERATKTEQSVVVKSSARKETAAALIAYQKNTAVVAQVISAESIKRSPDKNTGEVLKRVPGTSVQEGKYLVVRGLADRYNQAMLNGVLMSSTEPDRKTFSFDILPSSMIDNIIINKTFIPELPGEWAGGLVQVNTKDIPAKNFFNVQVGTGFNTQTIGKDFFEYQGSRTDFLGFDNGKRALPASLPNRSGFAALSSAQKTAYGKDFENVWSTQRSANNFASELNENFLINGGFRQRLGNKNSLSAIFALNYNRGVRRTSSLNQVNSFVDNVPSLKFDYSNNKYSKDILSGALANLTLQLGSHSKISFKNLLNVNSSNYATLRTGKDFDVNPFPGDNIRATELALKTNTFFNTQLSGDHDLKKYDSKFHWFGSFNILDQYIPDQRRLQYNQENSDPAKPWLATIGQSNSSQKSGSRYYGFLSDYIYTAGADLSKSFRVQDMTQTVKGGYFFQVKDRLFDSRPFAIWLPVNNEALRMLGPGEIFSAGNFGNGTDNKFALNELGSNRYRYVANSIMNAGYLQFDNQFLGKFRAVWGMRVEDFDQVIGSLKKSDPRFVHSRITDFLPGVNLTYKLNAQTNIRAAASQTVIRPEFRELSTFQFYDFDLGATIAGNTGLLRSRVSNFDLRYEMYPRAGELFTAGFFYKYFRKPIEAIFNAPDSYNFLNADEANSFGAEVEFRKKLDFYPALKNFTVQGNVSYIYNRVSSIGEDEPRPMQGQSPYLLNASVLYDLEKYGLSTTILFNQIGRRIAFVGGSETPPIWENPRPVLDLQLAKKIMHSKGEIKLNISDLVNKPAIFYNDLNRNKKYDKHEDAFAIRRKYGSNVSISFGYNF